jgi:hypothetical protein
MDRMESLLDRGEEPKRGIHLLEHLRPIVEWRRRWHALAWAVMVLSLVGFPLQPATAQTGLELRVMRLEDRVRDLETTVDKLQREANLFQLIDVPRINARLAALENTLNPVTRVGNELVITGVNLRIVNGLGMTDCGPPTNPIPGCPNGLGNVIVGYNESRPTGDDNRTGSHNVVVGSEHNFSRFGGLVVGRHNEISGASVGGGDSNSASDVVASVSGGIGNTASGDAASVSGGIANTASGIAASVSGGVANTASGEIASVSGGTSRMAPGVSDWAAGSLFESF